MSNQKIAICAIAYRNPEWKDKAYVQFIASHSLVSSQEEFDLFVSNLAKEVAEYEIVNQIFYTADLEDGRPSN